MCNKKTAKLIVRHYFRFTVSSCLISLLLLNLLQLRKNYNIFLSFVNGFLQGCLVLREAAIKLTIE